MVVSRLQTKRVRRLSKGLNTTQRAGCMTTDYFAKLIGNRCIEMCKKESKSENNLHAHKKHANLRAEELKYR